MLVDLKVEENCFLASILGCVAMHVYTTLNLSRFQNGEFLTKLELKRCGVLDKPYNFIKRYGTVIGLTADLPKAIFSREYCFPSVNEGNVWEKINSIEGILQEHGVDISFNLYTLSENKIHNTFVTSEKTVTANRVTSSICILGRSRTSRPRNHNTSFNLVLDQLGGAEQMHCSKRLLCARNALWNT